MNTSAFTNLLERVAESTDLNCHTESTQDVAHYFNMAEEVSQLGEILREHLRLGYMPSHLSMVREEIHARVMAHAKEQLTPEQFAELERCF